MNKQIKLSVSFGTSGTVYGCGHALDTFLFSQKLYTEDDLYSDTEDYAQESAEAMATSTDFEGLIIESLNSLQDQDAILRLSDYDITLDATELEIAGMLAGDYLQLERHESLSKLIKRVGKYAGEHWQDRPETSEAHLCPSSAFDLMQSAYDASMEYSRREWQKEALESLSRALFGTEDARITWDAKTDTVHIVASEEAIRELYGYDLDIGEPVPTTQDIEEYLKAYILHRCETVAEAKRIETLSRISRSKEETAHANALKEQARALARQRKQQRTA